jgi:hypothetical protein
VKGLGGLHLIAGLLYHILPSGHFSVHCE